MMHSLALAIFVSSALAIVLWWNLGSQSKGSTPPLPPGPPADPIIGHIRHLPTKNAQLTYMKWSKEYDSDVLYLSLFGQPAIILNSLKAATELLDKRGAKYSDRPRLDRFEEQGWTDSLTFLPAGPKFRRHRKMFQTAFSQAHIVQYKETQTQLAREAARNIIREPKDFQLHLKTFATSLILGIGYGITVQEANDPYVDIASRTSEILGSSGPPGTTLLDVFPIVRRLPEWLSFLVPSLKAAREAKKTITKLHDLPFENVRAAMAIRDAQPSFTKHMLEERESKKENNELEDINDVDIKGAGGTMFTAGQETTSLTLAVFMLAMTLNPEVARKAHNEIDLVIGNDRLPTFADRPKLHYIERIVQETLRWNPVLPLNIPHKTTESDIHEGYFIPKGSLVISNTYALGHDESIYSLPDHFDPDRYISLDEGGRGEPFPIGPFGFGRRICPGQYLAMASLWIVMATILATIDISKAKDEDGKQITPLGKMTSGLTSHPEPFLCALKSRSDKVGELLSIV